MSACDRRIITQSYIIQCHTMTQIYVTYNMTCIRILTPTHIIHTITRMMTYDDTNTLHFRMMTQIHYM